MFNLILFGPPGSGKGTQSENIIESFGLQHLSTGNLLRTEIANQTELGMEAKRLMDAGQLVPDAVVIGMVGNFMDARPDAKGFLFDGFPRTSAQAEALDKLLSLKNAPIAVMLALEVSEEEPAPSSPKSAAKLLAFTVSAIVVGTIAYRTGLLEKIVSPRRAHSRGRLA
jgi:adenylate kinase